jgi:ABC-type transporter Mla MlaB component
MQHSALKPVRDPEVQATAAGDGARAVRLSGAWDIRALESRVRALQATLEDAARGSESSWDLSQVERLDHIGALMLWRIWWRRRPRGLQLRREHEVCSTRSRRKHANRQRPMQSLPGSGSET